MIIIELTDFLIINYQYDATSRFHVHYHNIIFAWHKQDYKKDYVCVDKPQIKLRKDLQSVALEIKNNNYKYYENYFSRRFNLILLF